MLAANRGFLPSSYPQNFSNPVAQCQYNLVNATAKLILIMALSFIALLQLSSRIAEKQITNTNKKQVQIKTVRTMTIEQ